MTGVSGLTRHRSSPGSDGRRERGGAQRLISSTHPPCGRLGPPGRSGVVVGPVTSLTSMARTCSGRVGTAASEPFAAFLAVAEPQVSEPVRGWHVRLCAGEVLDDHDSWRAEVRQALVEELTNPAWDARPGDRVRAVRVRLSDLAPQERQQLDLPEGSGAIVVFWVGSAHGEAGIPQHIQDLIKARRRQRP
jgi:hypothetical protein